MINKFLRVHNQLSQYKDKSVADFFENDTLITEESRVVLLQNVRQLALLNPLNLEATAASLVPLPSVPAQGMITEVRAVNSMVGFQQKKMEDSDILSIVHEQYPDSQSLFLQLPLHKYRHFTETPRLKILTKANETLNKAQKNAVYTNIQAIYSKYFSPVYKNKLSIPDVVEEGNNIDLMFVIDSIPNFKNLYTTTDILNMYNDLKDNGFLVFISTDLPLQNIHQHQLKNTLFPFELSEPTDLERYFESFFAGHVFYMKRVIKPTNPSASSLPMISPSFATFPLESAKTDTFMRISEVTKDTRLLEFAGRDWVTRALPKLTPYFGDSEVLPINVVRTRDKANSLQMELLSNWSSVLDVHFDESQQYLRFVQSLNNHFVSFLVTKGSNSFFCALNTLFALKGMPLLSWDNLVQGATQYLSTLFSKADSRNIRSIQHYLTTTVIVEENKKIKKQPLNQSEAFEMVFSNFSLPQVEMYWFDIVATVFKVEIILVQMPTGAQNFQFLRKKPINWTAPFQFPDLQVISDSFPQFHLCKVNDSFSPLFPKNIMRYPK